VTRIISGAARGRRLAVPPGTSTRPTSDRAREGLFSTAEALLGGPESAGLRGARVLDLYAGSGAVGLEALSRGAAHALLVEADPRVARLVRDNIRALGLPGAEVAVARVERLLTSAGPAEGYDVVFADPPYALEASALREVCTALRAGGWLATGALVVVERSSREAEFDWPEGFSPQRSRRYGEGTLWYGHAG
jgi:16S rRNA (guanine966-N2)-methyltransferase